MLAVAIVVSRFDMEFVEWVKHDGSLSDRPARDDEDFCGAAAMPPDRDMMVRWKRLYEAEG